MKSSIYIIHDKKSPPLLMMNIWKHIYFNSNGFFVQSEKMIEGVDHKGLQSVYIDVFTI